MSRDKKNNSSPAIEGFGQGWNSDLYSKMKKTLRDYLGAMVSGNPAAYDATLTEDEKNSAGEQPKSAKEETSIIKQKSAWRQIKIDANKSNNQTWKVVGDQKSQTRKQVDDMFD